MTEEQYKHSHDSPSGHVVDLKLFEDEKQSYLTKSDRVVVNRQCLFNLLLGFVLGLVLMSSSRGLNIALLLFLIVFVFFEWKAKKHIDNFTEGKEVEQ